MPGQQIQILALGKCSEKVKATSTSLGPDVLRWTLCPVCAEVPDSGMECKQQGGADPDPLVAPMTHPS